MKRYYTDTLSPGPVAQDDEVYYVHKREEVRASVERLLGVAERLRLPLGVNHLPPCDCIVCENGRNVGELIAGLKEMVK